MSRGGWRYGAGRPGWHAKTTAACRLDVRKMARDGALVPGRSGMWGWGDTATAGYVAEPDGIVLSYRYQDGSEWRPVESRISLERTPCNFGGSRVWFCCPRCGKRVATIYLFGWPGCRTCSRMAYPSQSEDSIARSWRRTRKIERRLAGEGQEWDYQRPKGMHEATFGRLKEAWLREDALRDQALAGFLERYMGLDGGG